MADFVPDRLFVLRVEPDDEFRLMDANPAFLQSIGLARRQVIGHRIEHIVPAPFDKPAVDRFRQMVRDGKPVIWEVRRDLVRGRQVEEYSVAPVLNRKHRVVKLAGAIRDLTHREEANGEGRELTCHLLQLQDEERRRIGRELHDSTAQELMAVAMNLGLVQERIEGRDAANDALISDSIAIIEQCHREIRTLTYLLHPPLLEELGLDAAVHEYVDGFSQRSGIGITIHVAPGLGRLPANTEQALFRVLQESVANVHRHSGSNTASIRLWREDDDAILEIQDEGHGLSPDMMAGHDGPVAKVGVGIAGMRERLRQLGGRLTIESGERGTTVRAMAPVIGGGS